MLRDVASSGSSGQAGRLDGRRDESDAARFGVVQMAVCTNSARPEPLRLWCTAPRREPLVAGVECFSGETGQYRGPLELV